MCHWPYLTGRKFRRKSATIFGPKMTSTEDETTQKMAGVEDYSEWILESIDQLRKRKARPDLERICHMVERKHQAKSADIAAHLDKLVETQVVVKVDYKGSISFRNAAKWRKSHFGHVQNSSSSSDKLREAVRALTELDVDDVRDNMGAGGAAGDNETTRSDAVRHEASGTEIERWLSEHDPENKLFGEALQVALDREVKAYNLERTEKRKYIIGDPNKKPPPPEKGEKGKNGGRVRSKPKAKKSPGENILGDGDSLLSVPSDGQDTPKKSKPSKKKSPEPGPSGDGPSMLEMHTMNKISSKQAEIQAILSSIKKPEPRAPVREQEDDEDEEEHDEEYGFIALPSPVKTPSKNKNTRPAGKRKRIRKSHGPDFEESFTPPKSKSSRRRISEEEDSDQMMEEEDEEEEERTEQESDSQERWTICDYCKLSHHKADGTEEELLFCKDCPAKAHPSCMEYSEELARRARNSPWQCIECKVCRLCDEARDPDSMLFCDACDKGYHMDCHRPPVKEKPTGKWMCRQCDLDMYAESLGQNRIGEDGSEQSHSDGGGASCLPTPTASPLHFKAGNNELLANFSSARMNGGGSVHNPLPSKPINAMPEPAIEPSSWSTDEVVDFFKNLGFSADRAEVFRVHEIDGRSLLLMKRSDVLHSLGLKLGPALKIYHQINLLQTGDHPIYK